MNWTWEPHRWKKSTRVLLGMATIWPPVYIALFVLTIFSVIVLGAFLEDRSGRICGTLDLIQLDQKIKNGEFSQLIVRTSEIVATDRGGKCQFRTYVSNESSREEILRDARALDANGSQRVARVEEETSQAPIALVPIGIVLLFGAHMITILLAMGLMPLYIVLAVKSDRLDQNTRIIWVVLICMMGMFAMPVYWYLYVWRAAPPDSTMTGL